MDALSIGYAMNKMLHLRGDMRALGLAMELWEGAGADLAPAWPRCASEYVANSCLNRSRSGRTPRRARVGFFLNGIDIGECFLWAVACEDRPELDTTPSVRSLYLARQISAMGVSRQLTPPILSRGGLGPFIGFRLNIPAAPTSTRRTIHVGPASRSRTCSHAGQRQRPSATAYRMRGKRTDRGRHRSAAEALQPPVLPCRRHLRLQ